MSAIIHLMGRVTRDPVMQQGKNNGTEYISLDLATSQRSQNAQNNPENPYESVFYQCYLNKHLAERLSKAGVKKGICRFGDHLSFYQTKSRLMRIKDFNIRCWTDTDAIATIILDTATGIPMSYHQKRKGDK